MKGWLGEAAERFWLAVGGEIPFPRDLAPLLPFGFPVDVVALPDLSVARIQAWLEQRKAPHRLYLRDRPLCGCLLAVQGKGLIFVSSDDSPAEQCFTVAHEAAHFLLDYLDPRGEAIQRLGRDILPVLDGHREPTVEEAIDAVLAGVRLGLHVDLMPRDERGQIDQGYVLRSEERADELALELLAPAEAVLIAVGEQPWLELELDRVGRTRAMLTHRFGLPSEIAGRYARWLLRGAAKPRIKEWLGM